MLLTPNALEKTKALILSDSNARKQYAENSLALFSYIYLAHYIKSAVPEFHYDLYSKLQDDQLDTLEIIAFRGSGKSTIASLAYPLWSAIFKKRKFIILCSDTHSQAKQIITNLIYELEHNELLRADFGDFKAHKEDWTATNIYLKNGARIMSRSRGQKVRGLRHLQHRPDLVILDDVENVENVRTSEQRDKTEEWLLSDVIPSIESGRGKLVVIGSLLHNDSLIARMKNKIGTAIKGSVVEYPLINEKGENVWHSKYTDEAIENLKKNLGLRYFNREYQLVAQGSEDQLIKKISYYQTLPPLNRIAIGVDLAISKAQTADYTSINVAGEASGTRTIYNLQNTYGKWDFNETLDKVFHIYQTYTKMYPELPVMLGIEDVAYQHSALEEFHRRYGIVPTPIKQTRDKKARLEMMLPYFENDQILFKRDSMDDLINQLLGFGVERHDDCVDAGEISWRLLIHADRPTIQWL